MPEYDMDPCERGECYHTDCAAHRIAKGMPSPQDLEVTWQDVKLEEPKSQE